jgi:hypothetical protein
MVVETQAITHPKKTKMFFCFASLLPVAATTANRTAQTTKQPMLYDQ